MSGIGGLAVVADRVQVGALVFGAVAGVAEGLLAAGVLAQVGLLPRVAAQVDLQVLQAGEGLVAALELQGERGGVSVEPLEGMNGGLFSHTHTHTHARTQTQKRTRAHILT